MTQHQQARFWLKAFKQNFDAWVLTQVLTSVIIVSFAFFVEVFGLVVQDDGRPSFGKEDEVEGFGRAAEDKADLKAQR